MAKGKYEKWLEEENLVLLEGWARNGLTKEQIAHNMGITRKTLGEWEKKHSAICDALKKGKEVTDITVENSLYKKTQGYNVKVKKTFKCKVIEYDEDTGRKKREYEELRTGEDEIHIPADTTAMIYYLNNRVPERWSNKPTKDSDTTFVINHTIPREGDNGDQH